MTNYFEDDILAYVYLGREGNSRNKILLTKKQLIVIRQNKERVFDLDDIKILKITSRRLLLPMITGGIIFPFSMLSMITGYFSPYILLFTILMSIYLLYLGFSGHPVICLEIQPKEYDISIGMASKNIREFVNFVNTLLPKSKTPPELRMLYIPVQRNKLKLLQDEGYIQDKTEGTFEAFTYDQWQVAQEEYPRPNWVVILVDPLYANAAITYQTNRKTGELQPFLQGKMDNDAIYRIMD